MTQPNSPNPAYKPQLPAPGQDQAHHDQLPQRGGGGGDHGDHGGHEGAIPHDLPAPGAFTIVGVVALFALLLAALFVLGFVPTHNEEKKTRADAAAHAQERPVVQWARPVISNGEKDINLPCDVAAYQQTALYTRTNGYLKEWHFDIGQPVKQGDLMAVIATPEVDAQLEQSRANVEQAKANVVKAQADLDLARVTLKRYQDAQKTSPGSVTQEDIDVRQSTYDNAAAALKQVQASVKQAEANVQQLQTQVNFERIIAPFTGIVTARNYDVGALLSPTATAAGQEIFDLQQIDKLRVFVNVPQNYANNVRRGQEAYLSVVNFPAHEFKGTVALTAGAVNPNTRTLRVQIDFDNADGKLFAGAYGQIRLPVTPQQPVAVIPSSALVFNAAGLKVATLGPDDKVHVKTVTLGRDLGTELQVTSGLTGADRVIINPSEQTSEGTEVTAHEAPKEPAPATKPSGPPLMPSTMPMSEPATRPGGH